ncbi:hypothetical protein Hanom_Chr09g00835571 [Helianthus anomalus]
MLDTSHPPYIQNYTTNFKIPLFYKSLHTQLNPTEPAIVLTSLLTDGVVAERSDFVETPLLIQSSDPASFVDDFFVDGFFCSRRLWLVGRVA